MNIYVGNLAYQISEDDLRKLFEGFGSVTSSRLITDRETGRTRGFGFIEMERHEDAHSAIEALNGKEIEGRNLVVNEARPKRGRG